MAVKVRPDRRRIAAAAVVLAGRYGQTRAVWPPMQAAELLACTVGEVTAALRGDTTLPPDEVLRAALALIEPLRVGVDGWEMLLIDTCRSRDILWTDIGTALGFPDRRTTAKQGAIARRRRLGARLASGGEGAWGWPQ